MSHLEALLQKFEEDALFRRLAVGSPTWAEMVAEALMKDRTGADYHLAPHNAPAIDLVAENGCHIQVKTVGTVRSLAVIHRGRDSASEVMVIATFGKTVRFFLIPMADFKQLARVYDYPQRNHYSWEISGYRIRKGALDRFEIAPSSTAIRQAIAFTTSD